MQRAKTNDKDSNQEVERFRVALLDWYDRHRRVLPWRAPAGKLMDPYYVWLSEIMLQQTVVAAVIPYFQKFVDRWPTVHELAQADINEVTEAWAGLGYYARARNLHKCAQVVSAELEGIFPEEQAALKKLPGIGDYTSAAITAIAFDKPAVVVDGNVERVISRYYAIEEPLPNSKPAIKEYVSHLASGYEDRPGDFAQAMMDLGATICTPKSPKCMFCPLNKGCGGLAEGIQEELPYKLKKGEKPQKYGFIYLIKNEKGSIMLERRPEKGMLGGMLGFPCSEWLADRAVLTHGRWEKHEPEMMKNVTVMHSFTHFDLTLQGYSILLNKEEAQDEAIWEDASDVADKGLPTLFRKFEKLTLKV